LALKHFRELRSVTGVSPLAEEIMELQLLDRYDDAQMLLDAASDDNHARAESLVPDVLFAQAKQHYNLGRLRDADAVAAAVVELGQVIGTRVHVIEGTLVRAFVALLRGEPARAAQRLGNALDNGDDDTSGHPGVTFTRGWLAAVRGDVDSSRRILSQLMATPHQSRSYWAWWPCWMTILFEVGMACGAEDFTEKAIEIAEEGAERNPDVATLTGLALNMRGLFNRDVEMVAESVRILQHSPRRGLRAAGIEGYGTMLLDAGQRDAALQQLDAAWDDYEWMGASARRAAVQRVMRQAGVRRAKWVSDHSESQSRSLTDAERRVAYLIADGHTDKSAAKALGISVNTVGTHLRLAYSKLGVQSRVQLANVLRERGELTTVNAVVFGSSVKER
jgi:DNA-binding CsgD family transcriptional regulator